MIANVSRRGLLKGVAAAGGLVLAAQFPAVAARLAYADRRRQAMPQRRRERPARSSSRSRRTAPSRIVAARAEMGTGAARTALPMIVADELEADWARVRVVQSPGDEKTYGNQDTDGSRSVRHFIQPMRQCGAAARQMLEAAAAKRWGVARQRGRRRRPRGRAQALGPQARLRRARRRAAALPVPAARQDASSRSRAPSATSARATCTIVDLFDITTGKATYGQDVMLPGMKFAVVARPPVVGGKVASFDASRGHEGAGRREGGRRSTRTPAPAKFAPLGGVAVIAKNTWAAIKGREALKINWDDGPNKARTTSEAYKAQLEDDRAQARQGRAQRGRRRRGAGLGRQGDHGRVLRAAPRACHRWSRRRRPRA